VEDGERAIPIAMDVDLGLDVVDPVPIGGDPQVQGVKAHAVVVAHGVLEALARDIAEIGTDELLAGSAARTPNSLLSARR
jgi:hypothetical protein